MARRQRRRRTERRRMHAQRPTPLRRRTIAGAGIAAGAALAGAPAAQAMDFTVTTNGDGAAPGPAGSLRAAVSAANTNPGPDRVLFDSSLSGSIFLSSNGISITGPLEIEGPGADELAVDAYYGTGRIFSIDQAAAGDPVSISGLSLVYGQSAGSGGAIFNTDADLTVEGAFIAGNTAAFTGLAGGGIVDAHDEAVIPAAGTTIRSTTISGNAATAGSGGGVGASTELGAVVDSTIARNYAYVDGGGLLFGSGGAFQNSTIARNNAEDDAGGLFAFAATGTAPSLDNSIVGQNSAGVAAPDLFGSQPINAGFSLIHNTAGGGTINETVAGSNITGSSPQLPTYLSFGDATTPTLVPDFDSPVIDQGKTAAGATTDQRGEPRPFDLPDFANSAATGADGADMGSVELTTNETTPADLELELTDSPDPVFVGDPLSFQLAVGNDGPEDATNVEVSLFIPSELSFNAAASPGCSGVPETSGTEVTCLFDSVISGASEFKSVAATPLASAALAPYVSTYGYVFGDQVDPEPYDNGTYADTIVRNKPVTSVPTPPPQPPAFNLAAAIKKCKKKFRGQATRQVHQTGEEEGREIRRQDKRARRRGPPSLGDPRPAAGPSGPPPVAAPASPGSLALHLGSVVPRGGWEVHPSGVWRGDQVRARFTRE